MNKPIASKEEMYSNLETDIDSLDLENERLIIRGEDLCDLMEGMDFVEVIYRTLLAKRPSESEKRLFNASLISFHAGFKAYAPTILFPRIAASVGAPVAQALASGYAAGGNLHVGAVESSMNKYLSLEGKVGENVYDDTRRIIGDDIDANMRVFGFGHPLFVKDPRPESLRGLAERLNYCSDYLTMYDAIRDELYEQKGKNPNVDGINGAILLSMGFRPEHGVGLFLFSRTIGMLAHVSEELNRPGWSAFNALVGQYVPDAESGQKN